MKHSKIDRRSFLQTGLFGGSFFAFTWGRNAWATDPNHLARRVLGHREIRQISNIYHGKWQEMWARHLTQQRVENPAWHNCRWVNILDACREKTGLELIRGVNNEINRIPYQGERADIWKTPREFANSGGDCEDFAISKYIALTSLGFSRSSTAVAVLKQDISGPSHAVTLASWCNRVYVLDNNQKLIYECPEKLRKKIYYLLNERFLYF